MGILKKLGIKKNNLSDLSQKLLICDKNTPEFNLIGLYKLCKVVDVYDGDTIKVVFDLNGVINRWTVRMEGYNSPEIKVSVNNPARDLIKKNGFEARDFLKDLIQNEEQLVYIRCGDFDKYGRLLGTIYLNKGDITSVNQLMIDNNKGYNYKC